MERKEESVCAGELLKEVEEIRKLCSDKLQNNMVSETNSRICAQKGVYILLFVFNTIGNNLRKIW